MPFGYTATRATRVIKYIIPFDNLRTKRHLRRWSVGSSAIAALTGVGTLTVVLLRPHKG